MDIRNTEHLSDAELFGLAAPPVGEPEALPRHLSQCQSCSRTLQEWKAAVRALAEEDLDELARRTPQAWKAAEDATMAAIRKAGRPGRRRHPMRWAIGVAASLLILVLAVPRRGHGPTTAVGVVPSPGAASAALSPADQEDDALLRDVADLAQGGDDNGEILVAGGNL